MKKIVTILSVMLIMLFAFAIDVNAYTYNIKLEAQKTELKAKDIVEVNLKLSELEMDLNEAGIIGFEAILEYDSNVFSDIEVKGTDKWSGLTYSPASKKLISLIAIKENQVKESGDMATIELTVADNAKLGDTTISLKDIKTSNGTTVTINDISEKLTIVEDVKEENKNDNVTDDANKEENKNNTANKNNTTKDNTIANKVLSAAGLENISAIVVGALIVIAGISYMSYKKYKNM